MNIKIYKNGNLINRIVADETFAAAYCAKHGYTYKLEEPDLEPAAPTLKERVEMLESVVEDADAMNVDQEYRLTILELGLTDTEI